MRRIAAVAAFWVVVLGGSAHAERLVVTEVAAPPELAIEAAAIELLVKSSVARQTLVEPNATHDHTASATLARAGTGLQLDVAIVGPEGKRETASIVAGDGDIATLAGGMVDQIAETTHATQLAVRPFALGDLRPYASALRLASRDPVAAIAELADSQPVVANGLPAIAPTFGALLAAAPSPTARLLLARAIGIASLITIDDAGDRAVAASAHAFAAIERGDLVTAEAALAKAKGGLAALAHAAIAAERNDPHLGQLLEAALASDQQRAALALASTIVPSHLPGTLYRRLLLPLADRAATTSPGVVSRLGFAAAQANIDVAHALALVSVRELDRYALDALEPLLAAHRDLPRPVVLRLRAELAMRRRAATVQAAITAYLDANPAEPRAQQYVAWSKLVPAPVVPAAGSAVHPPAAGSAVDDFKLPPPESGALDLVLPIVAGVGVLVLATLLVLRKQRRAHPRVVAAAPAPPSRPVRRGERDPLPVSAPPDPRASGRLKIDMTTPPPKPDELPDIQLPSPTSRARAYPPSSSQAELGDRLSNLIDVELPPVAQGAPLTPIAPPVPARKPLTLPPPIEIASASRSLLDVDRDTPLPHQLQRDRRNALQVHAPLVAFADADPFSDDDLAPPPPPTAAQPPRERRPSGSIAFDDMGLAAPDLMPPGGAPHVQSKRTPTSIPFDEVELGAPDMMPLGGAPQVAGDGGHARNIMDFALDAAEPAAPAQQAQAQAKPADTRTLASVIADRGELPWLEAVGVIDQICASLAVLHAKGIVHGSVQPNAILITGPVARLADPVGPNKRPYIAPDRNGTASDDLYAVGATLAVMLGSGEMPEKLSKLVSALRAPLKTRPAAIADVRAAFKALFDF